MAESESSAGKAKGGGANNERLKRRREWWKKHRDSSEKPAAGSETTTETKPRPAKRKRPAPVKADDTKPTEESEEQKKGRYILFIGNLPFSATEESIKEHFKSVDKVTAFRLMTKKNGGSKGCGFLELDGPVALAKALKFHHTVMCARKINVELTCGGGGNSQARRAKVKFRNERKRDSRLRKIKAERENDENTGEGEAGSGDVAETSS